MSSESDSPVVETWKKVILMFDEAKRKVGDISDPEEKEYVEKLIAMENALRHFFIIRPDSTNDSMRRLAVSGFMSQLEQLDAERARRLKKGQRK